jgi:hypothetical protein
VNQATRAYLVTLGNPYAKLSILDEEEALPVRSSPATRSQERSRRHRARGDATQAYLFKLEDPYAKLSIVPQHEPDDTPEQRPAVELIWKTRTEVYCFVSDALALPLFRSRPPRKLKEFGGKVVRLSPTAQRALYHRISAHLPDARVVYNRLPPTELDRLLAKLVEMADDAAALDGPAD